MDCWRHTSISQAENMTSRGHISCTPPSSNLDSTLPCCYKDAECLTDNFCHFDTKSDTRRSGYYIAGCTDDTFSDSNCSQVCSDQPEPDAVYNPTTSLWQCCGLGSRGEVDCSDPKGRIFRAPAPEELSKFSIFTSSVSLRATESSTSSALSATSSTTAEPSLTPEGGTSIPSLSPAVAQASSELNVGAKAGISVGVVLGVTIIILLSVLLYLLKRKPRQPQAEPPVIHDQHLDHDLQSQQGTFMPREYSQEPHRKQELLSRNWESELDPDRTLHELSSNERHPNQKNPLA
ncbi:MAG: hypothetical protein Q9173_002668 [Seirophora scorigena]